MANNQFGTPLRRGVFTPGIFDDPDTIAQIAMAENPPEQQPSVNPAQPPPITGIVPKSFTEYAADPINAAKIPEAVPPNTPMPSVVAKAASTALASASIPPPIDSAIAGGPGAEQPPQLFPNQPAAASQPSLEDSLMSGPPNGGKGITAQSQAQQDVAPSGPLSKADFLAQHPVNIPGAPYVPHGGKLALTGLFAALDNAGAFLDHGTPTVGPGLMHNVQALQEYNQNLPVQRQQSEQAAYDEYLKNYGAVRQNTLTPITTIGPDGRPMTTYVDPATQKALLPANTKAGASIVTTQIRADSAEDVARLRLAFQQGKVARVMPVKMQDGTPGMAAYDAQGNLLHTIPGALPPAQYLPTSSTTQDVKEDGNGGYIIIPKTETKAPNLGGVAAGVPVAAGRKPMTPPGKQPQAAAGPGGSSPAAPPRRTGQPPTAGGTVARPVLNAAGGQQGGKSSADTGYAVDPQTQQTMLTTRSDAGQKGLQEFRKVSQNDIDKDRQITNRLSDVETKLNRYDDALQSPQLSGDDKSAIGKIIRSDKFKLGAFGLEVPVDQVNLWLRENRISGLSDAGVKALASYYNARESMSGYQRVLSGSNRGSDKTMELNIDALPKPTDPANYAKESINQFRENIPIMRRGLPVLPGVSNPNPVQQQGGNVAPEGTIVQVGNEKQIKQNGKWVKYTGQ
jgi:hypothetical protein